MQGGNNIMKKKIVGFFVCLILIIPIQSVISASQNFKMTYNFNSTNVKKDIIDIINQVNQTLISYYLEGLLQFGTRYTGSENCKKAAEYIYDEFKKLGLDTYVDQWRYLRHKCQNVVATLNGTNPSSDAVFLLCAHFDTIGDSPGANDDGSGIAAMLTIANICSKFSFNYSICFLAVSGEEVGLYGSHNYARKMYEKDENIVAVLNMDTIGNSTIEGENVIYLLKPQRAVWLSLFIEEISQTYFEHINLYVLPVDDRKNDQRSFLNYGYDAVQFVQLARGKYPLHTPQDTIEKINYVFLIKVTKLILATTVELADKPIDVQVRILTPYEDYLYLFDRPIFKKSDIFIGSRESRGSTYILGRAKARVNVTTEEEIVSVGYSIDGFFTFIGFFQNPPYDWEIQISSKKIFPIRGKHTLGVYVCTKSGKTAYDEMDITVLSLY